MATWIAHSDENAKESDHDKQQVAVAYKIPGKQNSAGREYRWGAENRQAVPKQTPKDRVTGKHGVVAAMSAISRLVHLLFRLHNKQIASPEVIDFLKLRQRKN